MEELCYYLCNNLYLIDYTIMNEQLCGWLDDEDPKAYFELKMVYNELTSDYMLEVIDWAAPDEVEDTKELWDSEIEKLKRVSGL